MVEEALARAGGHESAEKVAAAQDWTPQINIGTSGLIPDTYVADLGVRLGLYRRIAGLVDAAEIEGFAAEMVDRFGPVPAGCLIRNCCARDRKSTPLNSSP